MLLEKNHMLSIVLTSQENQSIGSFCTAHSSNTAFDLFFLSYDKRKNKLNMVFNLCSAKTSLCDKSLQGKTIVARVYGSKQYVVQR